MPRSNNEKTIVVHSAYKADPTSNNCNFRVHYNGAVHIQNTEHIRIRSVLVPNMFNNIYGAGTNFYIRVGVTETVITIAEGRYTSAIDLAAAIATGISTATGGTCTPTASSDGIVTFSNTVAFTILGTAEVSSQYNTKVSMNHLVGVQVAPLTPNQTVYTMAFPVALNGVRTVFVSSDKLGFGQSIHPSGHIGSVLCSVPLHNTPHGFVARFEPADRENYEVWFSDSMDCNSIDIKISDEYGQILSLPGNQHVEVDLVVGSNP